MILVIKLRCSEVLILELVNIRLAMTNNTTRHQGRAELNEFTYIIYLTELTDLKL
jgi:hypothetical protein